MGDDYNDLGMLQMDGLRAAACPGNAVAAAQGAVRARNARNGRAMR